MNKVKAALSVAHIFVNSTAIILPWAVLLLMVARYLSGISSVEFAVAVTVVVFIISHYVKVGLFVLDTFSSLFRERGEV